LELKYTEKALNKATRQSHFNVLEWWKNSGLPLKYRKNVIRDQCKLAMKYNQPILLEWWEKTWKELKE
jgi:hypothetical protein